MLIVPEIRGYLRKSIFPNLLFLGDYAALFSTHR